MRPLFPTVLAAVFAMLVASSAFAQDGGTPAAASVDAGTKPDTGQTAEAPVGELFEASLTQTSDTSKPIHAGETLTVTFEITHPADATVTFPQVFQPDRWVLISADKQPSTDGERATTSRWVATFGVYRPGQTTLRSFDIAVTNVAGAQVLLQTEPVEAKVLSIFADATTEPEFKEPRPPVAVWVEDYTLAFVGGGALFLALLGLVGWWVRQRQMMLPPPPPPPRAAHDVALEKLGALAGDDLVERGEYMMFWVRLSEAIREYLGRAYGFPGTEFTTTEMLRILENVKWPAGLGLEDIDAFLRRCDEVKFGGAEPGVDESTATLRRAFSFVELTRPRVVAPPPAAEGLGGGDTEVEEEGNDTLLDSTDGADRWAPPVEPSVAEEEE